MPPPVRVVKRGAVWRLVESSGRMLPQTFRTRTEAVRAARAINSNMRR